MCLRIASGDQPAHRVADQDQRQARVFIARELRDEVEIGGEMLAVDDQRPLAVRAAVAEVVRPVDRGAIGDEPLGDVVVAADVLGVAVDDQRDVAGVRLGQSATKSLPSLPSRLSARKSCIVERLSDGAGTAARKAAWALSDLAGGGTLAGRLLAVRTNVVILPPTLL